ncbi:C-type lectin fold [Trinorchestia longiramus]|nr:C-type lectin fold [Trinorchestia longiramus]
MTASNVQPAIQPAPEPFLAHVNTDTRHNVAEQGEHNPQLSRVARSDTFFLQKVLIVTALIFVGVTAIQAAYGPAPPGSRGSIDFRYPDYIVKPLVPCPYEGVFPHPRNCTWYYRQVPEAIIVITPGTTGKYLNLLMLGRHHQLGRLVSESACEREDPGSNPAADMVDAARNTAWDLGIQPNNYRKAAIAACGGDESNCCPPPFQEDASLDACVFVSGWTYPRKGYNGARQFCKSLWSTSNLYIKPPMTTAAQIMFFVGMNSFQPTPAWIGAEAVPNGSMNYQWIDGSTVSAADFGFPPSQPDKFSSSGYPGVADCIAVIPAPNIGALVDEPCWPPLMFLCEIT